MDLCAIHSLQFCIYDINSCDMLTVDLRTSVFWFRDLLCVQCQDLLIGKSPHQHFTSGFFASFNPTAEDTAPNGEETAAADVRVDLSSLSPPAPLLVHTFQRVE
jgi:hypothetical protein